MITRVTGDLPAENVMSYFNDIECDIYFRSNRFAVYEYKKRF